MRPNVRAPDCVIRLRLDDVPELARLPWEFLYDPDFGRFLLPSTKTSLVRYLNLSHGTYPLSIKAPLRLLMVVASPSDYPKLETEQEWIRLTSALEDLTQRGLVIVERMPSEQSGNRATLEGASAAASGKDYHILHFVGHGGFDEQSQNGLLVLEDAAGYGRPVNGDQLGDIVTRCPFIAFGCLECLSGCTRRSSAIFGGVAQSLVRQGIPAVIAMQAAVSDEASSILTSHFYGSLANGYSVDSALAEARKAIYVQGNSVEWGVPVLFMRTTDGRIFGIERPSDEQQKATQLTTLLRMAQAAVAVEEWGKAVEALKKLLSLDPLHAEAMSMLKRAVQQQQLPDLYARGREHYDAGRWREAFDYFRQVQGIGGNYRGVWALMATARHKLEQAEGLPAYPASSVSAPAAGRSVDPLDQQFRNIVNFLVEGSVVPLLGPNINLCSRPPGVSWEPGQDQYLPSRDELSAYLARKYGSPSNLVSPLVRQAQYTAAMVSYQELHDELREIFAFNYAPTPVHQFLATLPALLRAKGCQSCYQLIVTTNCDTVLEDAFTAAAEPFDVVVYVAEGENRGRFIHRPALSQARVIERPNEYLDLPLGKRTVILKVNGTLDPADRRQDSFVITEDDHIDYLVRSEVTMVLPVKLTEKLRNSHLLFMDYVLRDWDARLVFHRIWSGQVSRYRSWAVNPDRDPVEQEFWSKNNVQLLNVCPDDFVVSLSEHLLTLPPAGGGS